LWYDLGLPNNLKRQGTMEGVFGGLEFSFLLGWLMTVSIRHFVYRQPIYQGHACARPRLG
jgi:hypothetical protein